MRTAARRFKRLPQPWWQRPGSGGGSELDAEHHVSPKQLSPEIWGCRGPFLCREAALVRTNPRSHDAGGGSFGVREVVRTHGMHARPLRLLQPGGAR